MNARLIHHLGCSPENILYGIDSTIAFDRHENRRLAINVNDNNLQLPKEEDMMHAVWEHMSHRYDDRLEIQIRSDRTKDQRKRRYDQGVNPRTYEPGQHVFLRDTSKNLGKL